ncbi:hypothetical protein G3H81_07125 [Xylella fastidiosa subsp. fastidiosa]|nr:hypothetical protein [Xylella fastidiosa subsp. fastidiosa]MBE0284576.1 hypothetical protein [Xylella fastidiosa subsp. fastidiosa]
MPSTEHHTLTLSDLCSLKNAACTAIQQYSNTAIQQYSNTAIQQYSNTAIQQYSRIKPSIHID